MKPFAWAYKAWVGDSDHSLCTHDPAEFRDPNVCDVVPLYQLDRKDLLILELYREQHGETLTTLQAAMAKVRASAAELGMTIEEWNRKFGT